MKKYILILAALALSLFAARAYTITNDLPSPFTIYFWTNSTGTNYTTVASTNLAAGAKTVMTVSTNGAAGIGVQATNAAAALLLPWTNAPFSTATVGQLLSSALQLVAPRSLVVPQTQTILRSYFMTGQKPNMANYWELIDTFFWYAGQSASNAQAAASAAVAVQNVISASGKFNVYTRGPSGYWSTDYTLTQTNNVTQVAGDFIVDTANGATLSATPKFGTAMASTNYLVYFPQTSCWNSNVVFRVMSKTTTNFTFSFTVSSGGNPNSTAIGFLVQ